MPGTGKPPGPQPPIRGNDAGSDCAGSSCRSLSWYASHAPVGPRGKREEGPRRSPWTDRQSRPAGLCLPHGNHRAAREASRGPVDTERPCRPLQRVYFAEPQSTAMSLVPNLPHRSFSNDTSPLPGHRGRAADRRPQCVGDRRPARRRVDHLGLRRGHPASDHAVRHRLLLLPHLHHALPRRPLPRPAGIAPDDGTSGPGGAHAYLRPAGDRSDAGRGRGPGCGAACLSRSRQEPRTRPKGEVRWLGGARVSRGSRCRGARVRPGRGCAAGSLRRGCGAASRHPGGARSTASFIAASRSRSTGA